MVVRGVFPEKVAFNQNSIVFETVCQMYQIGNRETAQKKSDILKCKDFSCRVSKTLFKEKESKGYGPGGLAGEELLNVKFERDIEVWMNCGQWSRAELGLNPASSL